MTAKLDDDYRERLVFFNVSDVEDSYDFARDLLSQYVPMPATAPTIWDTGISGNKNWQTRQEKNIDTETRSI